MSQQTALNAEPLEWGHGPRTFDVFLEPTCPYSVKAFNKLDALLKHIGEDKVTVKIRLQSQPWHIYSGLIVRYILAASTLPNGRDAAHKVMQAVADHREEFEFADHCRGPNMDATPNDIIARLKAYSGVDASVPFDRADLQAVIKWHCKYARQNGIHVSPTFMVNGLVQADLGSGDDISVWAERILAC
ncbi:DsbA family protein [Enterobacter sp.]|uniref:DsbA family protein n=1 Tax=Enterobacter sp. TaxID=42895 RepID=UPI00296FBB60|nr:DsbA family protein [Enterobacter sp.]